MQQVRWLVGFASLMELVIAAIVLLAVATSYAVTN